MSRRSSFQYQQGAYAGHPTDGRWEHAAARRAAAGYTLLHAGRALRLGPIAFWAVVVALIVMGVWTITTATYFAFREDVLTRLIARQTEMQFGYEDRIAELRAQVDRLSSRQLLDQEQFEQRLEHILRRQTALEQRATTLNTLPDLSITGAIRPARPSEGGRVKPAPMNDSAVPVSVPARRAGSVAGELTRLTTALDRVEAQQSATLHAIEQSYDTRARRIRGVLTEL